MRDLIPKHRLNFIKYHVSIALSQVVLEPTSPFIIFRLSDPPLERA